MHGDRTGGAVMDRRTVKNSREANVRDGNMRGGTGITGIIEVMSGSN